MDEVPIATSNPVKTVFSSVKAPVPPPPRQKAPGTLINFFLMMPLAGIVLIQGFFLGQSCGQFTTLPFYTIQSYMTLGMVLTLMLVMQVMMRSIVYSTAFGFMFLSGVFHAWFGDFWTPLMDNFREVMTILKSAWTKRDIPFPLLMSTIMIVLTAATIAANFFLSLFVKYFFEVLLGREWGDGRKTAFITAILLMGIAQAGFLVYARGAVNADEVVWGRSDLYRPLEEYCARIPGGGQVAGGYVVLCDPFGIQAISLKDGTVANRKDEKAAIFMPSWSKVEIPVMGKKDELAGYDKDLTRQIWACPFPIKLPLENLVTKETDPASKGIEIARGGGDIDLSKENPAELGIPLILRNDISPDVVFAMFDYGFWAAISAHDGKILWVKLIDAPMKINRFSLDEFIRSAWVMTYKDLTIFSCYNGRITAVRTQTGDMVWEYMHKDAKYSGKGQRAYLSRKDERLCAAFPSGSVVAFDALKGTKIYEGKSASKWNPVSPAFYDGPEASFISADGNLVKIQVDGGNVTMQQSLFDNRPPLMPAPMNLEAGFAGYKDAFYHISPTSKTIESVFRLPKHVFATNPVVAGNIVYVGTQDGWIFGIHNQSFTEKMRCHISGELTEDSLMVVNEGILVRTRSGSVFCLKKEGF